MNNLPSDMTENDVRKMVARGTSAADRISAGCRDNDKDSILQARKIVLVMIPYLPPDLIGEIFNLIDGASHAGVKKLGWNQ